MPPVVTALYAALNAILNIALAYRVTLLRKTHKTSHGESDDAKSPLNLGIRAHGNNAEYVPLAIVMLLVTEMLGGDKVWLHVLGGTLLLARVLHPIGLPLKSPNPARWFGVALTLVMIAATSGYALYLRFQIV
jgi:uncharacterized membrane protein YecN with MAPEG domain